MMQTAAAAVAMAAAWQTEQRATQPVCGVANSAKFFGLRRLQFFSAAATAFILYRFLIFCCCFCCFFGEFFSLSVCVWRQVGVAAAAWRKVFRFPSGRTYTVSTLPRQLQQYVSVCECVCVWESVCASLCQWQRGVCLFFLRTVGHFWQTQQQR